jgi:hypothetical protein
MQQRSSTPARYKVSVDKASLHGQTVEVEGTGYSIEGSIYSVGLAGTVDERWANAFNIVQLDATGFFRYRFDPGVKRIFFQIRAKDGADRVILMLERLDELVAEVNGKASMWSTSPELRERSAP